MKDRKEETEPLEYPQNLKLSGQSELQDVTAMVDTEEDLVGHAVVAHVLLLLRDPVLADKTIFPAMWVFHFRILPTQFTKH